MAKLPPSFGLFSIGFGGANLPMRDVDSNQVLGLTPEWVINQRDAPAAYAIGATPQLSVIFQATNTEEFPSGRAFTIEARGKGVSVAPRTVSLNMGPGQPTSASFLFPVARPIKGGVGVRTTTLTWTATDHLGNTMAIGTSTHALYVTWTTAVDAEPPFEVLVRTSSAAAAGKSSVTKIAESLLRAIPSLHIARSVNGGSVRMALLSKSTDSGGFSAILNQMLSAHGIHAVKRAILIDWDQLPGTTLQWVPTSTIRLPSAQGPQVECVTLIPSGNASRLCDPQTMLGPITLPMALPGDVQWQMSGAALETMLDDYLEPAEKRRRTLPLPKQPDPAVPVTPFSVHFKFPCSNAIAMRDVITDAEIGQTPEWVAGIANFAAVHPVSSVSELGPTPAAFVKGAAITIAVTFKRTVDRQDGGAPAMDLTIGATGTPGGVTEQTVTLTFDPDGRSDPQYFTLDPAISNDVGVTMLKLEWYVKRPAGDQSIGASVHPLFFTWQEMPQPNPDKLPPWAYAQIVKWTSTFAAGATSDRDVCDRIFKNLREMGLKYGVAGWNPRQMLLGGGGMCGGWYQLFQRMAFCQGVFVERSAFLVDWRKGTDVQWNAIVVSNGGINQKTPPVVRTEFHDLASFPIPTPAKITTRIRARYRFWGTPEAPMSSDGHAINFLVVAPGSLILYDPSYEIGPIALAMNLPEPGTVIGGKDLSEFVAKYLTTAVSHMLGSFTVNGKRMETEVPADSAAGVNGVSVVTGALPDTVNGVDTITFGWL